MSHRPHVVLGWFAGVLGVAALQAGCRSDDVGFGGGGGSLSGTTSASTGGSTKTSSSASGGQTTTATSSGATSGSTASSTASTGATSGATSGATTASTSAATTAASSSSTGNGLPEICDNGIDDNGDGAIDCYDATCNGDNGGALGGTCSPIQLVQDGTFVDVVTFDRVFVTGKRVAGSGAVTLWVQEAEGKTAGGHTYPEYAGVEVFVPAASAGSFPDLAALTVGDCVTLMGTPEEFQMVTELANVTVITRESSGCGQMPAPYVIDTSMMTFDELASDEDPVLVGDQNGTRNEIFEGVLVRVDDVVAVEAPTMGDFRISPAGGTEQLRTEDFIFATPAAMGDTFTSITGVYDQFQTRYRLLPRSAADVVQ